MMKLKVGDRYRSYTMGRIYTAKKVGGIIVWVSDLSIDYPASTFDLAGEIQWGVKLTNFKDYYNAYKRANRKSMEK